MDPQESTMHVKQPLLLAAICFPGQEQSYQSGAQQSSAACQPCDKHHLAILSGGKNNADMALG